jgi:hypothetical protein
VVPEELVESLWSNADRLIECGEPLKEGDRTTVVRVAPQASAPANTAYVLKRYNLCGPLHTASHAVVRTRARWSWHNGAYLRASGICSPRPLLYLELRAGPLRGRSFLLTEYIDAGDLLNVVDSDACSQERLRRLAQEFGRVWRALGRSKVGLGDAKATNFLVDDQDRIWVIDLDGMRVYQNSFLLRRKRRRDYDRFMRNWRGRAEAGVLFRAQLDTVQSPAAK